MTDFIGQFEFIRPHLLWLIIPAGLLLYRISHRSQQQSAWQQVISPHLLKFLAIRGDLKRSRFPFWLTALLALVLIVAVSGPSFRQQPVPVFESSQAQVIVLDLSLSMDATDIKPSRLERAKFKLQDLLSNVKEGTIGLVVYAGDAFVISPLTSDANTISNMIPTLSTRIMPVLGSRPELAISQAIDLLKNAKHSQGQIIWLTDGIEDEFLEPIADMVEQTNYQMSVLALGTEQGAPIPLANGNGFLKDQQGNIVVPKLDYESLQSLVSQVNGGIVKFTADSSDIDYLNNYHLWQSEKDNNNEDNQQKINRLIDDGYWLIWLALLLYLIKIVRQSGTQMLSHPMIGLLLIIIFSHHTSALSAEQKSVEHDATGQEQTTEKAPQNWQENLKQVWRDLWWTPDQQAEQAFAKQQYTEAAKLFEDKAWQAAAEYRAGNFSDAAETFKAQPSSDALYNRATSLAKNQQLQPALDAYNKLLEGEPEHEDALFNKKIIEELLKQQEQQKQQDQEQQEQDQEQQQESDSEEQQDSNTEKQDQDENAKQSEQQESEQQEPEEQQEQEVEVSEDEREKSEKDQALEHWLEKIPDDPGGLLRRKMYREYQRRGRQQKEEKLW